MIPQKSPLVVALAMLFSMLPSFTSSVQARPGSIFDRGLTDECVALSDAKALRKLGFDADAYDLASNRRSRKLGREFEAAPSTFPNEIRRRVETTVLLNRSSAVTVSVLQELTRRGALVLSLPTNRLMGNRGSAVPDHAVHVREMVNQNGKWWMVVENCWGGSWGRNGVGLVPFSLLSEMPYVYGLHVRRTDKSPLSRRVASVLKARPFKVRYTSGRSDSQPTGRGQVRSSKAVEVNQFMDQLVTST